MWVWPITGIANNNTILVMINYYCIIVEIKNARNNDIKKS